MSELLTNLNTGLSRISPELTAKYAAKRRPEFLRKLGWSEEKIAGFLASQHGKNWSVPEEDPLSGLPIPAETEPDPKRRQIGPETVVQGYTDDVDDRGYGDPAGSLEDERGFADPLEGVDQQSREDILTAGGETEPSVVIDQDPTGWTAARPGRPGELTPAERAKWREDLMAAFPMLPPLTSRDQDLPTLPAQIPFPIQQEIPEQVGEQRIPRLLELLGSIGGQWASSRAIGSSNKANAARQARANLQGALRGGGGGAAFRETPSVGLLGHLATGLKGLGTGLQDLGTDEATQRQTDYENRTAQGQAAFKNQLDLQKAATDRIKADASLLTARRPTTGRLPTAGQNKVAMMELGRDLFDKGLTRDQVREEVQRNPDYQALVAQNPNIAAEMTGNALHGWDAREGGVFDREIDIAREERAKAGEGRNVAGEGRAVVKFTDDQARALVNSYTRRLNGAVALASTRSGSEIENPGAFFKKYKLEDMVASGSDILVLDLESAYLEKVGEYSKARVEYWQNQRELAYKKRERDFKAAAADLREKKSTFDIQDTLRKTVMALPGVKSFSGSQGLGPSFARMQGFHEDYRNGTTDADRAEAQVAMINQFQRLIDPATVRSQDIELYRDALSTMGNIQVALQKPLAGGFLPDDMIDGMMNVAISLHKAQRGFVESEVTSAISVWNSIHPLHALTAATSTSIAENILGGERTESDAERLARLRRERGGG